jgi:hypothetical protein
MSLEDLVYSAFGNNLVVGGHIRRQLAFLKGSIPPELQHHQMDDLGCGDGKVTLLLKGIFRPARLRGFDVHPGLVRRARRRGIDAAVLDLDKGVPAGELAVVWGVLHHLRDFEGCLRKIRDNYPLVFIREPVRTGSFNLGLELGKPLRLTEITRLVERHLPDARVRYCYGSLMVFYVCPGYIRPAAASRQAVRSVLLPV